MQSFIFLIVGLIQLSIAIYGTKQTRRHFNWYALLVLIVVYGLAYDNLVLASGVLIGEGAALKALNAPRFWIHALFTPTMIIAAFGALRLTGSKFGKSRTAHIVICVVATTLIALGSYIDLINLDLVFEPQDGVLKYANHFAPIPGPPIPAAVTIIFVLVFGVMMWRNIKWPWLLVGSLLMFIAAPMASVPIFQNIGEIAFAAGLVTTQIRAAHGS
ncbi:MAG: hypothetical protein R3307_03910 [Anaerolineales bacterium]|nr:hypothetical protein [Anaerolineales bacterium]